LREEIRRLRALGARHAALVARVSELDIPARLDRYAARGAADPLVILTLRQAQWENALRREEVRFEILRRYVEAADLAGALARRPVRNLLSGDLEETAPRGTRRKRSATPAPRPKRGRRRTCPPCWSATNSSTPFHWNGWNQSRPSSGLTVSWTPIRHGARTGSIA